MSRRKETPLCTPMKNKNTPDRIVTRTEGSRFYCAACRKTYQKCECKVYRSVDTLNRGKSVAFRRSRYVMLGGYALGVYRVLDNGKLKQLEQWPHAIKD